MGNARVTWSAENDRIVSLPSGHQHHNLPASLLTDTSHTQLLIKIMNPITKDIDFAGLSTLFEHATPKAIEERIGKLRREGKNTLSTSSNSTSTSTSNTSTASGTIPNGKAKPKAKSGVVAKSSNVGEIGGVGKGKGKGMAKGLGTVGGRKRKRDAVEDSEEEVGSGAEGEGDKVRGGKKVKGEVEEEVMGEVKEGEGEGGMDGEVKVEEKDGEGDGEAEEKEGDL